MRELAAELHRRNPVLSFTGWAHLGMAAVALAFVPIDQRTILGISPWIKPLKFMLSITIFVWTVGWLLHHVRQARRAWLAITWAVAISMFVEIVCIVAQSARGTTSHFNEGTPLDAAIFAVMGIMIAVNTLAAALLLALYSRPVPGLSPGYLWGIRLGIVVFLLGSAVGGQMVGQMSHAVGLPDGGPGLPFVNWSLEGGDLRVAHAWGLHALQALPLLGFALSRWRSGWPAASQRAAMIAAGAVYAAIGAALYAQAIRGVPLVAFLP
jgi:hypothetical protein